MHIKETGIEGLLELTPSVYPDDRGWFYEFYKRSKFGDSGILYDFVQENQSFSKKGVIRGLHLQNKPFEQAKLVSVIRGTVLDVVVDLREESKTFLQVYYCRLQDSIHNMLMVPPGFAHGFAALEDTILFYKCSSEYNREAESGVLWNDPQLNINWQIENPIVSDKDQQLPTLSEFLRKSVTSHP